jgi:hypothetical protein
MEFNPMERHPAMAMPVKTKFLQAARGLRTGIFQAISGLITQPEFWLPKG